MSYVAGDWKRPTIIRETERFHGVLQPLIGASPIEVSGAMDVVSAPQAFLVQQAANWTLPTHCHPADQFQLVSAGSGTLGRRHLEPLTLHYASAQTGYGPIVAGANGLDYYTIRANGTCETWFLPESRERLAIGRRPRHAWAGPIAVMNLCDLQRLPQVRVECLLSGEDGPAAWHVTLPPDSSHLVDSSPAATRFVFVAMGHVLWEAEEFGPGDLAVAEPESPIRLETAGAGAQLLVLEFARSESGIFDQSDRKPPTTR